MKNHFASYTILLVAFFSIFCSSCNRKGKELVGQWEQSHNNRYAGSTVSVDEVYNFEDNGNGLYNPKTITTFDAIPEENYSYEYPIPFKWEIKNDTSRDFLTIHYLHGKVINITGKNKEKIEQNATASHASYNGLLDTVHYKIMNNTLSLFFGNDTLKPEEYVRSK